MRRKTIKTGDLEPGCKAAGGTRFGLETTVEKAMARVARQWEEITDRYGREKQKAIYRSSMGLSY